VSGPAKEVDWEQRAIYTVKNRRKGLGAEQSPEPKRTEVILPTSYLGEERRKRRKKR